MSSLRMYLWQLKWQCYYYNNAYILWIKRHWRKVSNLILFITAPYILIRWFYCVMFEKIYGVNHVKSIIQSEKNKTFEIEFAVVTSAKNEGPYLVEWIEYYKLVGVDKIFFYDNESDDNTKDILEPYIKDQYVQYTYIKGRNQQMTAYNEAINKFKDKCRWMAFIDLDEYIMPLKFGEKIPDIVNRLVVSVGNGAAGIAVNWCNYGSSGFDKTPLGLTIANFVHRGHEKDWQNYLVKTICNPRLIKYYISPHYPIYKLGAYSINDHDGKRQWNWFCIDVDYSTIRVNHYGIKSKEQFIEKRSRGLGDRAGFYDMSRFDMYDLNEIEDKSMLPYAKIIKQRINS